MHTSFRPFKDVKPDKEQALKPLEEASEIYSAWQNCRKAAFSRELACRSINAMIERRCLIDECVDTIQAVVNVLASIDCKEDELIRSLNRVIERNKSRGRVYDE